MTKKDFEEFYSRHKNRDGFLKYEKIERAYDVRHTIMDRWAIQFFFDNSGRHYMKRSGVDRCTTAEVLLSRLYEKLGLRPAIYYPAKDKEGTEYVVSRDLSIDHGVIAANYFKGKIFEKSGNIFPNQNEIGVGKDTLTGDFTPSAVTSLLKMRLLDAASGVVDRHPKNFFYQTEEHNGVDVATGVRPIDFGLGAFIDNKNVSQTFFNNFVVNGEDDCDKYLNKEDIIEHFKQNETAQQFLPLSEASKMIGSVDFQKLAQEVKDETGFKADQQLLDVWSKSFEDMAEDLEQ